MAKETNCECCGIKCEKRYSFRYPNSNNQDTTKQICKECHQKIRIIINEYIDSITTYSQKQEGTYPVVYPNAMNDETIRYLLLENYRVLETKINDFIEGGGV